VPREGRDLLDDFGDEAAIARHQNPFGLAAMGCAIELCADTYRSGYHHAGDDARHFVGDGPRVTRGGAAICSPWQGCGEAALMFSALRGSLADPDDDFIAVGLRPALDWPGPPELPGPRAYEPEQLTLWSTERTAGS
jgi:hypothetical protein